MQKFITYIKTHKITSIIILVVVLGVAYYGYQKMHTSAASIQYITQQAQKTTITVSVTGSGQVSEQNKIDLKPSGSGTSASSLVSLNVKQGDTVKAGQIIATVDEKNNILSLNQAKASLASAQANYEKVAAGTISTDIQQAQASVDSAQTSLDNAKASYTNVVAQQKLNVSNAYTSLLNAGLAAIPAAGNSSTATISLSGAYSGSNEGSYSVSIQQTGGGLGYSVSGLESGFGYINRGIPLAIGKNGLYITFSASGNVNSSDSWVITLPNPQSSSYLSNYNSYQSALLSQTQSVNNAQAQINSAQSNLESAQAALASKQAPATPQDLAVAQAQVDNAQVQVESAQVSYNNNILRAPFNGVVAQVNNQVGDPVNSSTVIATLVTKENLATMSLNEVDVSKIQLADKATLTFDAIDGLTVTGTVAEIDTIGTVSQGVVTYSLKIGMDTQDSRIKPGMSVTAAIITAVKTDVIAVPNSAVKSNASGSYIQILDANTKQPVNTPVEVGVSNDTLTEITSGISEGQSVITQTINSSAKTSTTTSSATSALRLGGLGGGGGGGGAGAAVRTLGR